jgi:hypothetical protein
MVPSRRAPAGRTAERIIRRREIDYLPVVAGKCRTFGAAESAQGMIVFPKETGTWQA